MKACNAKLRRNDAGRPTAIPPAWRPVERPHRLFRSWGFAAAWVAGVTILFHILPAHAQPAWQPKAPQYVQCPAPAQPLLRIPELVSLDGKLRATIMLNNNVQRMFLGADNKPMPAAGHPAIPWCERDPSGLHGFDPARLSRLRSAPELPGFAPSPLANTSIQCRARPCGLASAT